MSELQETEMVVRFGDEMTAGPAVDGVPTAEHPVWVLVHEQVKRTAGNYLESPRAYEIAWGMVFMLLATETDLDVDRDGLAEQIEDLAHVLAGNV